MKLLIIEDEKITRISLSNTLQNEGYNVFSAENGEEGLMIFNAELPDIVITDLRLPKVSGLEILDSIMKTKPDCKVILITAYATVETAVKALKIGAYDYLTKPFVVEEVMVRLKNVRKRLKLEKPLVKSFNQADLQIFPLNREVTVNGEQVILTKYEFDILNLLATHKNIVYSREQIISICFEDSDAYDRVIDTFIKNIRKKIDVNLVGKSYIKTHYGLGYQFVGEADA